MNAIHTKRHPEPTIQTRRGAPIRRPQLAFDSLEERLLLSCDINFNKNTGVLTIEGSSYGDVANVSVQGTSLVAELSCGNGSDSDKTVKLSKVTKVVFKGAAGDDFFINGTAKPSEAYGDAGNDHFNGGSAADLFFGGADNDSLSAGAGNDTVHGGDGDDTLDGLTGNDVLNGDADNDQIWGDIGNDTMHGGIGNDLMFGNSGNDEMHGDAGHDTLAGSTGNDVMHGGDGHDVLDGSVGNDIMTGGLGNDELQGGDNNDLMVGDNFCVLDPAPCQTGGNDTLVGGLGLDTLIGGVGSDYLDGSYDGLADLLYGGSGKDTFVDNTEWLGGVALHDPDQFVDYAMFSDIIKTVYV